jgi:hypothetical protein
MGDKKGFWISIIELHSNAIDMGPIKIGMKFEKVTE